ncbi:MAG: GNAT family N-acetyltransferase [Hyphomonadaceae bacterium]
MKISKEYDTFLQRYAFVLSDDPGRLDMEWVLDRLMEQYWFEGEPRARIQRAIEGAHPYGVYAPDGSPAGFLSVLSDGVYNARLSNLFLMPDYRGRGLGRWIMSTLLHSSRFSNVRNWQLQTDDAQALYRRFGFEVFVGNGEFMTLTRTLGA